MIPTSDTYEAREALGLRESIEAMRLATEDINKKLGDAYPKGIVPEIEDIKRRLCALEAFAVLRVRR
jgi:hypothetical protein